MSKETDKIKKMDSWFKDAEEADTDWAARAKEDRDFYWSRQWAEEDKNKLTSQGRPVLTFNEIKPAVNLVSGIQRQNRTDIKVLSRTGDTHVGQVFSALIKEIEDQSNAEFEYSRQFLDGIIEGKGFLVFGVEYDKDIINGDITIQREKPGRVKVDPSSEKYDISDAEYTIVESWHTKEKLKLQYPDKKEELSLMKVRQGDTAAGKAVRDTGDYKGESRTLEGKDLDKNKIRAKTCWHRTFESKEFLYCSETGEIKENTEKDKRAVYEWKRVQKKNGRTWISVDNIVLPRLHCAIYAGDVMLQDVTDPIGKMTTIPVVPFFAYWDGDNCQGMVADLKDPQREVNKRHSQYLHLLNTSANSPWIMEEGSVPDESVYRNHGATPGQLLKYNKGLDPAKIPHRMQAETPSQGHILAEKLGEDFIKKISNVNADLMGQMSSGGEPGIVVNARQRQGILGLEPLNDNFRYTRKLTGQLLIEMIQKGRTYDADEIITIIGRAGIEMKADIDEILNGINSGRHDAVVDMAVSTPTVRLANYYSLVEAVRAGVQIPPEMLLEANPDIPETTKQQLREKMQTANPADIPGQ